MALHTVATTELRVIDADVHIHYTRRKVYGTWTQISLVDSVHIATHTSAWEYVRTATKTYRYVGLTQEAAAALHDVLVEYYTRSTKISEWSTTDGRFNTEDAGDIPMADVVSQHDEGDAYSVVVSVREEDRRQDLSANRSFAVLFATENLRTYDTGDVPS